MSGNLMVHAGGWHATEDEVRAVTTPPATDTFHPIPHGDFVDLLDGMIDEFDLKVQRKRFALAKDGARLFGVYDLAPPESALANSLKPDWALSIGLRGSHDKTMARGLAAGHRVFVCDNTALSGEVSMTRKHTSNIERDLRNLMAEMFAKLEPLQARQAAEINGWKGWEVTEPEADHAIVQAIRGKVIPITHAAKVIDAWDQPPHPEFEPRTVWSLFNAFTEAAKTRTPEAQYRGTLGLSGFFRKAFPVLPLAA